MTETLFLILRVLPSTPVTGSEFSRALEGLTIRAYDRSVNNTSANPVTGEQDVFLGEASGVILAGTDMVTSPATRTTLARFQAGIIQHTSSRGLSEPVSVATAVIIVTVATDHQEYPINSSFDVRFDVDRANAANSSRLDIPVPNIDYNISCSSFETSLNTTDYIAAAASSYIFISPVADSTLPDTAAYLKPGPAGLPPAFAPLQAAVNKVLELDHPLTAPSLLRITEPLSIAQCSQIASAIVYNRWLNPPPAPPDPDGDDIALENMYTSPANPLPMVAGDDKSQKWEDLRHRFERDISSYYAINNSDAKKLAGYVFAISAAHWAEYQTYQTESQPRYNQRALIKVPICPGMWSSSSQSPANVQSSFSVILTSSDPAAKLSGGMDPPFIVPAAYFYALGARYPPQISARQRFQGALTTTESHLISNFETAIEMGILIDNSQAATAGAGLLGVPAGVSAHQAARRMSALAANFAASPLPHIHIQVKLPTETDSPVARIVSAWLKSSATTEEALQASLWAPQFPTRDYLMLILHTLTWSKQHFPQRADLINKILDRPVNQASNLVSVTNGWWKSLFKEHPDLLPPFTLPGSIAQRSSAFIAFAGRLFDVGFDHTTVTPPSPATPDSSLADNVLLRFIKSFPTTEGNRGSEFSFAAALETTVAEDIERTLRDAFADDFVVQDWVRDAIRTIGMLYKMTLVDPQEPALQFSYMEALYSRGFKSAGDVTALSSDEFNRALIGTVAYGVTAEAIHTLVSNSGLPSTPRQNIAEPGRGFQPVNTGGLVNCVPPGHLDPLGAVQYLSDLLLMAPSPAKTLGKLVSERRGTVSSLKVTRENLEVLVPTIDLVLESLESMASNAVSVGEIRNVDLPAAKSLLGLESASMQEVQDLLRAVPQFSSPSLNTAAPRVYGILKTCFTSPRLPYNQPLDVTRSYLRKLETTKLSTMRHMRKAITELPSLSTSSLTREPEGFDNHRWRMPVRFEIALEYLNVSMDEYTSFFSLVYENCQLALLYGHLEDEEDSWISNVVTLSGFLGATGLTYYELREFVACGFVKLRPTSEDLQVIVDFPEHPPCCMNGLVIGFEVDADSMRQSLFRSILFIRLWRKLQEQHARMSMAVLADIAFVLRMFSGVVVNSDFIRQLSSLLMLVDILKLPWLHDPRIKTTGYGRTKLLAIWAGAGTSEYDIAVSTYLESIDDLAERQYDCPPRHAEYRKLLQENLTSLSSLSGFFPPTSWNTSPTCTIRFTEILTKIYASHFTVGEIIFLFTVQEHLDGDDPFHLPSTAEGVDTPLDFPEDNDHGLWNLRRKLLAVEVHEEDTKGLSWLRIEAELRNLLGLAESTQANAIRALNAVAEHFFPSELKDHGRTVPLARRRWITPLHASATSVHLWSSGPGQPFHYDPHLDTGVAGVQGALWGQLPIADNEVIEKLRASRQLNEQECTAVQNLYFAPRATLAPIAFLFENFSAAVDELVSEADEKKRFASFKRSFALFSKRCRVIIDSLAEHVCSVDEGRQCTDTKQHKNHWQLTAKRLLRSLVADENTTSSAWENDAGTTPMQKSFAWSTFSANAYAAILGLVGTGMLGKYSGFSGSKDWTELGRPLIDFGEKENRWNTPVISVLPPLHSSTAPAHLAPVLFKNGFALHDHGGTPVEGAHPFDAVWDGMFLVDQPGEFQFFAGQPSKPGEHPHSAKKLPVRWLVTLGRPQKTWVLLNNCWPDEDIDAPVENSKAVRLKRGAYHFVIRFRQDVCKGGDGGENGHCGRETGFEVKYQGPDTNGSVESLDHRRLIQTWKSKARRDEGSGGPETEWLQQSPQGLAADGSAVKFWQLRYYSTLRDIRRTYERAFKALLLAHKFQLSAEEIVCDHQSEIGFILDHPDRFLGTSHYPLPQGSGYRTHRAFLDFNLLPVQDNFGPPVKPSDSRADPSPQRQAALFDSWERLFDYTLLRGRVRKRNGQTAWLLFEEANRQQPTELQVSLRHLGVDLTQGSLVLTYLSNPLYRISAADLFDERWAIRVWHANNWISTICKGFTSDRLNATTPALWASGDSFDPLSGNQDLVQFVQESLIKSPGRNLDSLRELNDGLRERARDALFAYLCGAQRTSLPFMGSTAYARVPRDLSELLFQDVQCGLDSRVSRIHDGIQAVVSLVQRAKLGLEPSWTVTSEFEKLWMYQYSSFEHWQAYKRRQVYSENWVQWEETKALEQHDGTKILAQEMKRKATSIAQPGRPLWWPATKNRLLSPIEFSQSREFLTLSQQTSSQSEGLSVLGTPLRDGRPTLLAAIDLVEPKGAETHVSDRSITAVPQLLVTGKSLNSMALETKSVTSSGSMDGTVNITKIASDIKEVGISSVPSIDPWLTSLKNLPLWLRAAVRLGARFVRVAAASMPYTYPYNNGKNSLLPCSTCGADHPAVTDEYYFWLQDTRYFKCTDAGGSVSDPLGSGFVQNADLGATGSVDPQSDWFQVEDRTKLQSMMNWTDRPMVHLFWTRVHMGTLDPLRRSTDGLPVDASATEAPDLRFLGRNLDTLTFLVSNTLPLSSSQLDTSEQDSSGGFLYDIVQDSAASIELPPPTPTQPQTPPAPPLAAFPYFIFFEPGKPLIPTSPMGILLATASVLKSNCEYESATLWYRSGFDPTARDNAWVLCKNSPDDKSKVPADTAHTGVEQQINGAESRLAADGHSTKGVATPLSVVKPTAPEGGRGDLRAASCCDFTAKGGIARARSVLLQYLDTLLLWVDSLVCRNSAEAWCQAKTILNLAARILGPEPTNIAAQDIIDPPMTVGVFKALAPALNPSLLKLYSEFAERNLHVKDAEKNIVKSHAISASQLGTFGQLDNYYVAGASTDRRLSETNIDSFSSCQPYRFTALIGKALESAIMLKNLGSSLLSAFEKGDGEYFFAVRQSQERHLLDLQAEISQNQWRAADWDVQALNQSMDGALHRLRYYQDLVSGGLNFNESAYMVSMLTSMASRAAAHISYSTASATVQEPDRNMGSAGVYGTPVDVLSMPGGGDKNAHMEDSTAKMLNTVAAQYSSQSSLSKTQGSWDRRVQDWQHQIDIITMEIQQTKRQQLAAWRRRQIALKELNNHQRQMEHAAEVQSFIRDKLTKNELYLYLQQELAALYTQTYRLVLQGARQAQAAFWHERADFRPDFLRGVTWNSLHEGLMVGEQLELSLRAMDHAYSEQNCREHELTKQFSLRRHFAQHFRQLKATGHCEIDIPEWMFDKDYPGFYLRRIRNITMSIPLVAGPYTGVHCRLQLLKSSIRYQPLLPGPAICCCPVTKVSESRKTECRIRKKNADHCLHCLCTMKKPCRHGQRKCKTQNASDDHLITCYSAMEAIASSDGMDDDGLFELSFRDERYLPFEFSGAVSRWRIELPREDNQFDFDSIGDFIIKMNYTAREGGDALRRQAREAAVAKLPDDGMCFIDVRHDMPDAWLAFQGGQLDRPKSSSESQLDLRLSRNVFPWLASNKRGVAVQRLHIFFEKGEEGEDWPCGDHFKCLWRPIGPHECCRMKTQQSPEIVCRKIEDGRIYYGHWDVCLPLLRSHQAVSVGTLRVQERIGTVRSIHILCEYEVQSTTKCECAVDCVDEKIVL